MFPSFLCYLVLFGACWINRCLYFLCGAFGAFRCFELLVIIVFVYPGASGVFPDNCAFCSFFVRLCNLLSLNNSAIYSYKLCPHHSLHDSVNTMIADAVGLFPRLCSNLSDIVFQKTKGSPFFVLEFLRSLVDSGLLSYSVHQQQWTWDEHAIKSTDVSDNVLFLLTHKMSGLSEEILSTIKVLSCFGIRIHASLIDFLSEIPQFSNIRAGLEIQFGRVSLSKSGTIPGPQRRGLVARERRGSLCMISAG